MRGKRVKALRRQFRQQEGRPPGETVFQQVAKGIRRGVQQIVDRIYLQPKIASEWRALKKKYNRKEHHGPPI